MTKSRILTIKLGFFTLSLFVDEIYPDIWGVPYTIDIPKLNFKINLGVKIEIKFFLFKAKVEFTICLR